jgi:hypothetical protein
MICGVDGTAVGACWQDDNTTPAAPAAATFIKSRRVIFLDISLSPESTERLFSMVEFQIVNDDLFVFYRFLPPSDLTELTNLFHVKVVHYQLIGRDRINLFGEPTIDRRSVHNANK